MALTREQPATRRAACVEIGAGTRVKQPLHAEALGACGVVQQCATFVVRGHHRLDKCALERNVVGALQGILCAAQLQLLCRQLLLSEVRGLGLRLALGFFHAHGLELLHKHALNQCLRLAYQGVKDEVLVVEPANTHEPRATRHGPFRNWTTRYLAKPSHTRRSGQPCDRFRRWAL